MKKNTTNILLLWALFLVCGCSSQPLNPLKSSSVPDFGTIYNRSAQYQGIDKNPVIVIHGILGSRLVDTQTGRNVWGEFSGGAFLPQNPEGMNMLSLPMSSGTPLRDLKDSVVPDGALERVEVQLLALPLRLNAYGNIMQILGASKDQDKDEARQYGLDYGDDHFTCFQFAYDWRRDIAENARALKDFIEAKKVILQKEYKERYGVESYDVKFDIVAHSMGGLISRYYLMYGGDDLPQDGSMPEIHWEGARNVDRLIMIGTPNAGLVESFIELVNGVRFVPILPQAKYEAALLGTFPSYYQLFPPKYKHAIVDESDINGPGLNIFNPDLWVQMEWGLASPDQSETLEDLLPHVSNAENRRQIAIDHLKKCLKRAERIIDALHVEIEPPENVSFYLYAGDAEKTDAVVAVNKETRTIRVVKQSPGDGIVTRSSALLDDRVGGQWSHRVRSPIPWSSVMFVFSDHMGITEDPTFIDNILFYLLEK